MTPSRLSEAFLAMHGARLLLDGRRRRHAALLQAVDEAGADVIELGLRSDPIADGPVLQAAATRALAAGATVAGAGHRRQLRLRAPVVAMGS